MEIKFNKNDLLTLDTLRSLHSSNVSPNEKAKLISEKLMRYIIINEEVIYQFDKELILYNRIGNSKNGIKIDNYLITVVSQFISNSYDNLTNEEKNKAQENEKFTSIYTNNKINTYFPQLKTYLENSKINFKDPQLNKIHFKNCYYDFNSGKFRKRKEGKHFINYYIDREYFDPSEEAINKVKRDIKKIYPDKQDRDYLLMTYGLALTGQACKDQTILFLLGNGSGGKSTIIEICKLAFGKYVETVPSEFLSRNYTKIDKVINTYLKNPFIRISHMNEPEDTKFNDSLFKQWTDGKISSTSLYVDGTNQVTHYSKIAITSNTFPNIKIDSGTKRRIDSVTHKSKFIKRSDIEAGLEKIDETNHIYEGNENLLLELEKDEDYLNAFFFILSEYGYNCIHKIKVFGQSKNFEYTKEIILQNNDIIQDYIDRAILKTDSEKDRINREDIYKHFKEIYPKSHITQQQLQNSIKEKGFDYKCDLRANNMKGCFINIKFKSNNNVNFINGLDDQTPTEHQIKENNIKLVEENQELKSEIELLKDKIKKLEEQLNKKPEPKYESESEEEESEVEEEQPKPKNNEKPDPDGLDFFPDDDVLGSMINECMNSEGINDLILNKREPVRKGLQRFTNEDSCDFI
jgi:hypothetical protein